MNRQVTVYEQGYYGYGCFKRKIDVTDKNFVSETEHWLIIVEDHLDHDGGEYRCECSYAKDIDTFIESENVWYDKHVAEIKERHELTLKNAESFRTSSEA